MAAPASHSTPVGPDTPIVIKAYYDGTNRRFRFPLKDMGAQTFPIKLREALGIATNADMTIERYSDSAARYITLDSENISVYKQLYRAAKAKLKLRVNVTVVPQPSVPDTIDYSVGVPLPDMMPSSRPSYMDTVLGPQPARPVENTENPVPEKQQAPQRRGPAIANPHKKRLTNADVLRLTHKLKLSGQRAPLPAEQRVWIDCNKCGNFIRDEHYHCSLCDKGDYDLCTSCVESGSFCPGEGHWLIRRFIKNGIITASYTSVITAPRKPEEQAKPMEQESTAEVTPSEDDETKVGERTCNACFRDFAESELVSCNDCSDYDLCHDCLLDDKHGHHPGHAFSIITDDDFNMRSTVASCCKPGRSVRHAAICDGCDKDIRGIRHKCLSCPDWDYCSGCVKLAGEIHPDHRFAAIYEPIAEVWTHHPIHFGIFCDGPLCTTRPRYVQGIRYKCAVCHDTDFCANCEAHPSNPHNNTHPLIKFKSPVRHVSVSTLGESGDGARTVVMGDQPTTKSASTETAPPTSSNAATQVQNEIEPEENEVPALAEPIVEEEQHEEEKEMTETPESPKLEAFFVRDTIPDGSLVAPGSFFVQSWTLYNPGPSVWPAGCSVRFVGGDVMFNVNTNRPSSLSHLQSSMESVRLEHPVLPLQHAEFDIALRAPEREGRAVSYWRLRAPDGTPFGHKLWCEVEVRSRLPESRTLSPEVPDKQPSVVDADEIDDTENWQTSEEQEFEVDEEEKSASDSTMIFPKLDTESPVASTHEAASSPITGEQNRAEEPDLADDVESLALCDADSDEEFLTDEEYDILDASDQEFIDAGKPEQK
ncbi:hypothetical protein AJ80_07432 [Polytolypa hystricis UAMH7299]|uniref:ZZ-type domain-containing protein n=1 Tax=Polytolypa hystricis (strain UAMH7299) TaxID=1447883 RepID=A0A2B7XND9_POLH7|nr:hypothetical protein AJ80_07432 [Polytolypa hystricis UAMH7299]